MKTVYFGAGSFWSVEEAFRELDGVISTSVGFTGGITRNPTYEMVCFGGTGHAEAVKVEYDPSIINFEELLVVFWASHDPTQLNRQGADIGEQYRSEIFCTDEDQLIAAINSKKLLENSGRFTQPIQTKIELVEEFFNAERHHQKYLQKRAQDLLY